MDIEFQTPTEKNISIRLLKELSDPLMVSYLTLSLSATSEAIFKLCFEISNKYIFLYNFCISRYLPVPQPNQVKLGSYLLVKHFQNMIYESYILLNYHQ